ncbi:hypothetical protein GCM10023307_22810 [Lysobacter hankyongensis]|uniref:histidine kinase n=1 Tax=Lysobacter hankyongensis TaxID=1176535 RepID=A0ABP9BJ09_9GAMM
MTNATAVVSKALRPRARILRTLGEELISSETVALIELVKNSYDADAGYVLIRFHKSLEQDIGSVSVEDNGHGMSLSVVERSWMEPATNNKKKMKQSAYLKRRLLGEKGVGRFAAARLASELELSTRAAGSSKEIYAYFDWSQFDNEDVYLDEVIVLAEERDPEDLVAGRHLADLHPSGHPELPRDGSHGTVLRMNGLKRGWSTHEVGELRRGLSRLISPFEAEREFRIFLQLPDEDESSSQELEPPEVIKYPHYTLKGDVDAQGKFHIAVELHATGETEVFSGWFQRVAPTAVTEAIEPIEKAAFMTCGPISFQIFVWDRDQLDNVEQKIGTGIRSIRKDLDSIAGISIYRDGFRVLPYGEQENDWLKLDLRRVQNPTLRISNNQLTGFIKIGADTNPQLKDQSNREGLDNNQAYADLQEIIRLSLAKLESLRFREKKKRPGLKESGGAQEQPLLASPDTVALKERLIQLGGDEEALTLLEHTTNDWEAQIIRIKEVLSRYHSLATLGQLVDKVIHDGRQPLLTIQGQSTLVLEALQRAAGDPEILPKCSGLISSLTERVSRVKDSAGLIDLLLRRIEPLGGRKKGRPSKVYLNEIVRNAFSHFSQEIDGLGINVTIPNSDDLVQVDALELQEVLINLIGNSIYWLQQSPKGGRKILVEWTRPVAGEMDIIFADSGPGIPKSNRSSIFEPYFSTKPDGLGLGLVIAGEIIRDYYNGSLELLDTGPLSGAAFRIKLRKRV